MKISGGSSLNLKRYDLSDQQRTVILRESLSLILLRLAIIMSVSIFLSPYIEINPSGSVLMAHILVHPPGYTHTQVSLASTIYIIPKGPHNLVNMQRHQWNKYALAAETGDPIKQWSNLWQPKYLSMWCWPERVVCNDMTLSPLLLFFESNSFLSWNFILFCFILFYSDRKAHWHWDLIELRTFKNFARVPVLEYKDIR